MTVYPTLDNTWGTALIGMVGASILYGVTTLQLYIYFLRYPRDRALLKLLAVSAWLLDTISLGFVINAMYGYLVTDMANPLRRLFVNRTLDLDPAIMGALTLLTHCYLGWRAWNVCRRNLLIGILLVSCSLAGFSLAIASAVISFRFELWTEMVAVQSLGLAGTSVDVFLDIFISGVLCTYLLKQKAQERGLKRLIRRSVAFSINTGLISSLTSLTNIITFVVYPKTMIFLGSNFLFTKVYANCILANLNIREPHDVRDANPAVSYNVSGIQDISAIVYRGRNNPTDSIVEDDRPKKESTLSET